MKNKKRKTETKNKQKGITLISLVVTIGVLIVLAGVTLGSIKGDNGIITKTKSVKKQAEIEDIKEKIQNEIIEQEGKSSNGKLTESQIDNILSKYGTVNGTVDNKTVTTSDGYVIKITELTDTYEE